MKKITYLPAFITLCIIISCERDVAPAAGLTGQWEVTAYNEATLVSGPFKVSTFKDPTAENDSITIQDIEEKFWKFKVKALADEKNGTFETKSSKCEVSGVNIGIKIPLGKVFYPDSIYFEIQFEDDETPYGNTYILKGRRING